jgi:hypothetical protein
MQISWILAFSCVLSAANYTTYLERLLISAVEADNLTSHPCDWYRAYLSSGYCLDWVGL